MKTLASTQKVRRGSRGGLLISCLEVPHAGFWSFVRSSTPLHCIQAFGVQIQHPFSAALRGCLLFDAADQLCKFERDSLFAVAQFHCRVFGHFIGNPNTLQHLFNRWLRRLVHRLFDLLLLFQRSTIPRPIQPRTYPYNSEASSLNIHFPISPISTLKVESFAPQITASPIEMNRLISTGPRVNAASANHIPALTLYLYRAFALSGFCKSL